MPYSWFVTAAIMSAKNGHLVYFFFYNVDSNGWYCFWVGIVAAECKHGPVYSNGSDISAQFCKFLPIIFQTNWLSLSIRPPAFYLVAINNNDQQKT